MTVLSSRIRHTIQRLVTMCYVNRDLHSVDSGFKGTSEEVYPAAVQQMGVEDPRAPSRVLIVQVRVVVST